MDGIVARWAPVWSEAASAARSGDRARLDVRPDWAPSFAWLQRALDGLVASWTPAFNAEMRAERVAGVTPLDARGVQAVLGWPVTLPISPNVIVFVLFTHEGIVIAGPVNETIASAGLTDEAIDA